jgi:dienelactone hydrolase
VEETVTSPAVISAEPAVALVDQAPRIIVSGLPPGAEVTIAASAVDGARRSWRSRATFRATQAGVVDLTGQAPLAGGYQGTDPAGLLWSMRPAGGGRAEAFFSRRTPRPVQIELSAEIAGETVARQTLTRVFAGPDVSSRPADSGDLTGTLHCRPAAGPEPGVLLLGGSDGGQLDHAAALLASHGHAVLALTYFGAEDLPPNLMDIDLGYLTAALDWLTSQPEVRSGPVGIIGLSRGGELALQVACMDERVGAVVAASPSSVRQPGTGPNFTDFRQPAWRADGEPLPFLPGRFTARAALSFMTVWLLGRPLRLAANFTRALRGEAAAARAAIEVERIRGPVLVISGSDDQLWPSDEFAGRVMARLREHGHPYQDQWLRYPGAGHFVCFPYALPTLPPMTRMSPAPRMVIDFGGTAAANARSATESWARIRAFLAEHLAAASPRAQLHCPPTRGDAP